MRADTHDGPEQMLHLEAEYIVAALTFVDLKRHLAPRGRAIHHGTSRHRAVVGFRRVAGWPTVGGAIAPRLAHMAAQWERGRAVWLAARRRARAAPWGLGF